MIKRWENIPHKICLLIMLITFGHLLITLGISKKTHESVLVNLLALSLGFWCVFKIKFKIKHIVMNLAFDIDITIEF